MSNPAPPSVVESATTATSDEGFSVSGLLSEFMSPVNLILTLICGYLAYRILRSNQEEEPVDASRIYKPLPPLPKQDMTLSELKTYNGTNDEGRICFAVNRKIFDVTKGKSHYGKGGPYATFAGHDCTRALATFQVDAVKDTWDDYDGISSSQMASAKEWEEQFNEQYDFVGYLVKEKSETADEERDEKDDSFEKIDQ